MSLVNLSSAPVIPPGWSTVTLGPPVLLYNDGVIKNQSHKDIYEAIAKPPSSVGTSKAIPQWKVILNEAFAISMPCILVTLSLAMGCHVHLKEVLNNFWPPFAICVGLIGQFVVLPALAFTLTKAFEMEAYVALGCLIISCSPGGAFSNFFTYWVHGDVSLSLVMTICSTLLAFGAMPFNLWLYSSNLIGEDSRRIEVPYKSILTGLAYVCVAVISGMTIRHFSEKIANKITKILSFFGYILISVNILMMLILFWKGITSAPVSIHFGAMILPISGISIAYFIAFVAGRPHKICRTIGIETSSQNVAVGVGIILLSFPEIEIRSQMILFPTLYTLYMTSEISAGAIIFNWFYNHKRNSSISNQDAIDKI